MPVRQDPASNIIACMKKTMISWIFLVVIAMIVPVVFSSRINNPLVLVTSAVIFLFLLLFFRLTVKVDSHYVHYIFGIGLVRGKFALENIDGCRPVRDIFLGWGIKYRPEATILNISGRYAIELTVRGQKAKVLIGTNHPESVCEYINSRLMKPLHKPGRKNGKGNLEHG